MKARPVEGLDCDAPLLENAQRMASVRIAELWSLGERALNPSKRKALHDTRIAAKRVRYLLEITEPCFGPPAKKGAKVARQLQDLLGEIHDCDVMSERVRARSDDVPVEDERYIGLEALASYLEARRRVLHRKYVEFWNELEKDGFRGRLEESLGAPA
jgi:CHAD domain-containing protein